LTPEDGGDPRTFPAIFNDAVDDLEAVQSGLGVVESGLTSLGGTVSVQALITEANSTAIAGLDSTVSSQGAAIVSQGSAITVLEGTAVALGSAVFDLESDLSDLELGDLADVTIGTAVADGNVLAYSTAVSGWVDAVAAGGGGLVEVKHVLKQDTFVSSSISAGDNVAVTGLSITHAVANSANRLLITAYFGAAASGDNVAQVGLAVHDGSGLIAIGNADGSRTRVGAGGRATGSGDGNTVSKLSMTFVHTPGAGSKTYTVRAVNIRAVGQVLYVNRPAGDSNTAEFPRATSGLVIQEIEV
jgi:hypothetical protein